MLRDELRKLREMIGEPTYTQLEAAAKRKNYSLSTSTITTLLKGGGKPHWRTVEAFVVACGCYARNHRIHVSAETFDLRRWHDLYEAEYSSTAATNNDKLAEKREAYLQHLRRRYSRIDTEILLPIEYDECPSVQLREVFVPPAVRVDPPPVDLPRHLRQKLIDANELDDGFPEGVDRDTLARLRQAYQERPPQPVLRVLTEPGRHKVVILGDPGSGKSTLARYLALCLASGTGEGPMSILAGWLPLLIELRTYADERWRSGTFLDLLDHLYTTEGLGLPKSILESFLEAHGQAVVIFDGLDELFDRKLRETVTHQIAAFATRYPQTRVVVTSRVIGYRRQILDGAGFTHYMLQDLDRGQIAVFATRWYSIACPGDSSERKRLHTRLLDAIRSSPEVGELAGNPMLLTILAIIGRRRELPRDRRAVYDHAVTVLIEQWEVNKHLAAVTNGQDLPQLDRDDKRELLRLIARRMQDAPREAGNHIHGTDLLAEFCNYVSARYELSPGKANHAARVILDQFRERNFILSRFGAEVYGFVHRAFLEYLAAADIVDRFNNLEISQDELINSIFARHWAHSDWHEVLLLVVGMKERFAGPIIDFLLSADPLWSLRPDQLPRHALLATRCLGEIRKLGNITLQSRAIVDTITTLLETARQQESKGSSQALTRELEKTIVPVFAVLGPQWTGRRLYRNWYFLHGQYLPDPQFIIPGSGDVVSLINRAAAVLHACDADFRYHLHTQAILSPQWTSRRAAIQALAAVWGDDPGVVSLIRERAKGDEQWPVRQAAVQALVDRWGDDPEVVSLIKERITTDRSWNVRQAAVQALVTVWRGDVPEVVSFVRECARGDEAWPVRQAAVQALVARWGDDSGVVSFVRECAVGDCHESVRQVAVQSLAAISRGDTPEVVSFVRECAVGDCHESVRQVAVQALVTVWRGDAPEVMSFMRGRASDDESWSVRQTAVQALVTRWRDDSTTVSFVRECAVGDCHENVRQVAVQALGKAWRGDSDIFVLVRERARGDESWSVRQTAIQALVSGWRDDSTTVSFVRECAVGDCHESVRQVAVQALGAGWQGNSEVMLFLRERATTDRDIEVRQTAIRVIAGGWREDPTTLAWLRERATADHAWHVRQIVVETIASGWQGDPTALAFLCDRARSDDDSNVRQTAIQSIVMNWLADSSARLLLRERAIEDSHENIRQMAVQALGAMWGDDSEIMSFVRERAIEDSHENVRQMAIQAITSKRGNDPTTVLLFLRERAIYDPHGNVRNTVVRAIATCWRDDSTTLPFLCERATSDPDWPVRQVAIQSIAGGWRANPTALALLRERAIHDEDSDVRQMAVQMIASGWRGDFTTVSFLRERAANDIHESVRAAATKALTDGWPPPTDGHPR